MSCTDATARKALDELFAGELADDALQALRAHADTCDGCRAQYDRIARVEARLEGVKNGGLAPSRAAFLERALMQRVQAEGAQATAPATAGVPARVIERPGTPRESLWERIRMWLVPAGALAAAGLAVMIWAPRPGPVDDGYQARGTDAKATFGVRAFCVAPGEGAQVKASAAPGETLSCPPGMAVQFAYTAPVAAKLTLVAPPASAGGEPLEFLSSSDAQAQVKPGTDVTLPFSTPVSAEWLRGPVEVKARFEDPGTGAILGESTVKLVP